jgi:hypothetical protein
MPSKRKPMPNTKAQKKTSKAVENQPVRQEAAYKFAPLSTMPEDSYADGAASITGGRNVIKIDFYRVVGIDQEDKKEVRKISHRLVFPLTAIPELRQLLQGYGQAVQKIIQDSSEQSAKNGKS